MDNNNDYTFAGKGRKHRERLEYLERQAQLKPEGRGGKPTAKQRAPEFLDVSGQEMKRTIRLLTLKHDTFEGVSDALRKKGYRASGVMISAVRTEMKQIVKLLIDEGVLDAQLLSKRSRAR